MTSPEAEQLKEFEPLTQLLSNIPTRGQRGFYTYDLELTCIDVSQDFIVLGSNAGTVFLYHRGKGTTQRLHCEPKHKTVTCVKVQQCLDDLIAAGLQSGDVCVFQLPSDLPGRSRHLRQFKVSGNHQSPISCLEFSSNGVKLFSGDNDGLICLTELHLDESKCLSSILHKETQSIVQLQYNYFTLLASTKLRTVLCKTDNGNTTVVQVGTKDRKCPGPFGGCYKNSQCKASEAQLYASRPGFRVWLASIDGVVSTTFMFKDFVMKAVVNIPLTQSVTQVVNLASATDKQFGPLLNLGEDKLVTWNGNEVYVLNVSNQSLVACTGNIGPLVSVAVHKNELFILRMGLWDRRVIRVSSTPEVKPVIGRVNLNSFTSNPTHNIPARRSPQQLASAADEHSHLSQLNLKNPFTNFIDKVIKNPVFQHTSEAPRLEREDDLKKPVAVYPKKETEAEAKPEELPPIVQLNMSDIAPLEVSDEHKPQLEEQIKDSNGIFRTEDKMGNGSHVISISVSECVGEGKEAVFEERCEPQDSPEVRTGATQVKNQQLKNQLISAQFSNGSGAKGEVKSREAVLQEISLQQYDDNIVFAASVKPKKTKKKKRVAVNHQDSDSVASGDTDSVSQTSGISPMRSPAYSPRPMSPLHESRETSGDQCQSVVEDDLYSMLILPERLQTKVEQLDDKADDNSRGDNPACNTSTLGETAAKNGNAQVPPKETNRKLDVPNQLPRKTYLSAFVDHFDSAVSSIISHKQVSQLDADLVPVIAKKCNNSSLRSSQSDKSRENTPEKDLEFLPINQVKLSNEEKLLQTLLTSDDEECNETKPDVTSSEVKSISEEEDLYENNPLANSEASVERQESWDFDIYGTRTISESSLEENAILTPEVKEAPEIEVVEETSDSAKISALLHSKYSSSRGQSLRTDDQLSSSNGRGEVASSDSEEVTCLWPKVSESWMAYSTSGNIQSLAISATHVWYVDKSENAYCSKLSEPSVSWKKVDQPASQLVVSPSGSIVWRLHKNCVYAGSKITSKYPWGMKWNSFATEVEVIALDDKCGWYIKSNGGVMYQPSLSKDRPTYRSLRPVGPEVQLIKIACAHNVVWGITEQHELVVRLGITKTVPGGTKWTKLELSSNNLAVLLSGDKYIPVADISIGDNSLAWVLDKLGRLWCKTGVTMETPEGRDSWWQVSTSEYLMQDQGRVQETITVMSDITQNLSKLLLSTHGGLVAAGTAGVWLCPGLKNTIQACRDNLIGHQWCLFAQHGMASSSKWSIVDASINDGKQGAVWLVHPNGELFCFSPTNASFVNVSRPRISSSKRVVHISCSEEATWVLIDDGRVFIRDGINHRCPAGTSWVPLVLEQLGDARFVNFSCGLQNVWAVDARGTVYLRIGVKAPAVRYLNPVWVPVDHQFTGLSSLFTQVATAPNDSMVWAIDCRKNVYVRQGISETMPIGTSWKHVQGTQAQQLCISNDTVWAMDPSGQILCRYGINTLNECGDYWKKIPGTFSSFTVSADNKLWAISQSQQLYRHYARHLLKSQDTKTNDDWELL